MGGLIKGDQVLPAIIDPPVENLRETEILSKIHEWTLKALLSIDRALSEIVNFNRTKQEEEPIAHLIALFHSTPSHVPVQVSVWYLFREGILNGLQEAFLWTARKSVKL